MRHGDHRIVASGSVLPRRSFSQGLRLTLCLALGLVLVACGEKKKPDNPKQFSADRCTKSQWAICLKQCQSGHAKSCSVVGTIFESGSGVEQSYVKAAKYYRNACNLTHYAACAALGRLYDDRILLTESPKLAAELFDKACLGESPAGCYRLGMITLKGRGVDMDPARTGQLWQKACKADYAPACTGLGSLFAKTGDDKQALAFYEKGCKAKDLDGCTHLARFWVEKAPVKDYHRAAKLFEQSCQGGHREACAFLGNAFGTGQGVKKDLARAVALNKEACDKGTPLGCYHLAGYYARGKGVEKDQAKSIKLYETACDAKLGSACTLLAFRLGQSSVRNDFRLFKLYEKACKYGEPIGCCMLGDCYNEGKGVAQDLDKAVENFHKACDGGHQPCCKRINKLRIPSE